MECASMGYVHLNDARILPYPWVSTNMDPHTVPEGLQIDFK